MFGPYEDIIEPENEKNKIQPSEQTNAYTAKYFGTSFVRDAVRVIGPSVVRIDCERQDFNFLSLFIPDSQETLTYKVSGSGVVMTSDGYMLTNAHVVKNANKLSVTLANGRSAHAKVIQIDELTDIAVIKAELANTDIKVIPVSTVL
jgi:serine protease Do